jgi:hypothetical protein
MGCEPFERNPGTTCDQEISESALFSAAQQGGVFFPANANIRLGRKTVRLSSLMAQLHICCVFA